MDAPEFNTFKPFLQMSQEMQQINPMFAYYIKTFAVQKASTIYKSMNSSHSSYQVLKQSLNQWIDELTQVKRENPQVFNQMKQNQDEIQDYIMKLFFDTDSSERNVLNLILYKGEVSKELVKNFLACSRYFEVLTYFSPLSPEIEEKRKYSKIKAVELTKKLKNPELYEKQPQYKDNVQDLEKQMREVENKVNGPQANIQASLKQPQQNSQSSAYNQPTQQIPNNINTNYTGGQDNMPKSTYNQGYQNQQQTGMNNTQAPVTQNYQQQPPIYDSPQYQQNNQLVYQQQQIQNYSQKEPPFYQDPNLQITNVSPVVPFQSTIKLSALKIAEKRNLAKKLLEHAISELDFKKYTKAKENLEQALQIVEELEKQ